MTDVPVWCALARFFFVSRLWLHRSAHGGSICCAVRRGSAFPTRAGPTKVARSSERGRLAVDRNLLLCEVLLVTLANQSKAVGTVGSTIRESASTVDQRR
jgi:hypothetical protein